jgi:hypothetical protein
MRLLAGFQASEASAEAPESGDREDGQAAATLRIEVERQRREIIRLTELLRQHGIEPGGDQRSA